MWSSVADKAVINGSLPIIFCGNLFLLNSCRWSHFFLLFSSFVQQWCDNWNLHCLLYVEEPYMHPHICPILAVCIHFRHDMEHITTESCQPACHLAGKWPSEFNQCDCRKSVDYLCPIDLQGWWPMLFWAAPLPSWMKVWKRRVWTSAAWISASQRTTSRVWVQLPGTLSACCSRVSLSDGPLRCPACKSRGSSFKAC